MFSAFNDLRLLTEIKVGWTRSYTICKIYILQYQGFQYFAGENISQLPQILDFVSLKKRNENCINF